MKRIQPFTIGTKLSIPVEPRWNEGVDIYMSSPPNATTTSTTATTTSTDGCRQNFQNFQSQGLQNQNQNQNSQSWTNPQHHQHHHHHQQQRVENPQVISPVGSDSAQEDQTLDSPSSTSSRSIKKIAICTSGELSRDEEQHCTDVEESDMSPPTTEGQGIDRGDVGSRTHGHSSSAGCGDLPSQLKSESRPPRLRPQDPKRSSDGTDAVCTVPSSCSPAQHSEGTMMAQQWELKDFENSLIQLTASLDFREEDAQEKHERNDLNPEKQRETEAEDENEDDLNRPWLRLRTLLRTYQRDLMLALDVSNFYQQADNLIKTINTKRRSVGCDTDVGEIAVQIKMLREAGSRLSDVHPTLASRVSRKQAEVKHSWARLQDALRNQWTEDPHPPNRQPCSASEKPSCDPVEAAHTAAVVAAAATAEPSEVQGIMGKDIKEEQNRLKGVETRSWLRDNIAMALTDQEKMATMAAEDPNCPKIEELLRQVETLWEQLRSREGRPPEAITSSSTTTSSSSTTPSSMDKTAKKEETLWEQLRSREGRPPEAITSSTTTTTPSSMDKAAKKKEEKEQEDVNLRRSRERRLAETTTTTTTITSSLNIPVQKEKKDDAEEKEEVIHVVIEKDKLRAEGGEREEVVIEAKERVGDETLGMRDAIVAVSKKEERVEDKRIIVQMGKKEEVVVVDREVIGRDVMSAVEEKVASKKKKKKKEMTQAEKEVKKKEMTQAEKEVKKKKEGGGRLNEEVEVEVEEEEVRGGGSGEVKECGQGPPRAKVPPGNVGECDSGMLTKFLEHLETKESHGMWQVVRGGVCEPRSGSASGSGSGSGCFSVSAKETLCVRVCIISRWCVVVCVSRGRARRQGQARGRAASACRLRRPCVYVCVSSPGGAWWCV
ncbi:protein phosphatase 1 regulatory subunit 12A-like isoform X4 [Engraulis encrasicolus]|uniref:protein phosphatase 1 regulatory subunit 12A-like isoform X4 n=1 Tax=Engraulis encrasicolus TaxID=184585 RepID=UPI002FCEC3CB